MARENCLSKTTQNDLDGLPRQVLENCQCPATSGHALPQAQCLTSGCPTAGGGRGRGRRGAASMMSMRRPCRLRHSVFPSARLSGRASVAQCRPPWLQRCDRCLRLPLRIGKNAMLLFALLLANTGWGASTDVAAAEIGATPSHVLVKGRRGRSQIYRRASVSAACAPAHDRGHGMTGPESGCSTSESAQCPLPPPRNLTRPYQYCTAVGEKALFFDHFISR